jgi:hypothetical protein
MVGTVAALSLTTVIALTAVSVIAPEVPVVTVGAAVPPLLFKVRLLSVTSLPNVSELPPLSVTSLVGSTLPETLEVTATLLSVNPPAGMALDELASVTVPPAPLITAPPV